MSRQQSRYARVIGLKDQQDERFVVRTDHHDSIPLFGQAKTVSAV
jgi:hypothetical protein